MNCTHLCLPLPKVKLKRLGKGETIFPTNTENLLHTPEGQNLSPRTPFPCSSLLPSLWLLLSSCHPVFKKNTYPSPEDMLQSARFAGSGQVMTSVMLLKLPPVETKAVWPEQEKPFDPAYPFATLIMLSCPQ